MAKDDFDFIAFKILAYYYACLKNKIIFNDLAMRETVRADNVDDDYFSKVLRSLALEGYIEGLVFTNAWGNEYILSNNLVDGCITHAGVQYLRDNSVMKRALKEAQVAGGLITKLLPLIF